MLDTSHELAGPAFALVCLVKLLIILLTRTSLDATWNGLMHLVEERGLEAGLSAILSEPEVLAELQQRMLTLLAEADGAQRPAAIAERATGGPTAAAHRDGPAQDESERAQ